MKMSPIESEDEEEDDEHSRNDLLDDNPSKFLNRGMFFLNILFITVAKQNALNYVRVS